MTKRLKWSGLIFAAVLSGGAGVLILPKSVLQVAIGAMLILASALLLMWADRIKNIF